MSIDNIKYVAWTKFFMEFVTMTKLSGKNVMLFKSGENSDVNGFISCFHAHRMYDRHNEDELYGVIV
jgi:hypothetical protein